MPERKPAGAGRDAQVAALQEKGLTFRPVPVVRPAKRVKRFGKWQMRKETVRTTIKLVPPGSKRWSRS